MIYVIMYGNTSSCRVHVMTSHHMDGNMSSFQVEPHLPLSQELLYFTPMPVFHEKAKEDRLSLCLREKNKDITRSKKKKCKWLFTICDSVPIICCKELFKRFGTYTDVTSLIQRALRYNTIHEFNWKTKHVIFITFIYSLHNNLKHSVKLNLQSPSPFHLVEFLPCMQHFIVFLLLLYFFTLNLLFSSSIHNSRSACLWENMTGAESLNERLQPVNPFQKTGKADCPPLDVSFHIAVMCQCVNGCWLCWYWLEKKTHAHFVRQTSRAVTYMNRKQKTLH